MEKISTLYTNRSKSSQRAKPATSYGLSVERKNQVVTFAGRLISYILGVVHGPISFLGKSVSSQTAKFSQIVTAELSENTGQMVEEFPRFEGEPPDIPGLSPPDFQIYHSKKAYTNFAQRPMNEQIILKKSIHEDTVPATAAISGAIVPLRQKALRKSSFTELLSSFTHTSQQMFSPIGKGACSALTLFLLWLVASPALAQTPTINLRLHSAINSQAPKIGDVVTYTVVVANAPGSATATTVSVKEELPSGGVAYVPGSASVVRGTGTYTPNASTSAITGIWTIPAIAPGDSAVLTLRATVKQQGVWFNKAEVVSADQTDLNSIPNNQSLTEDDYDAVCFSVPILWYPGDEYTVTIPSGYDQIVWYRNDVPISTSAVSTSLAEVNSDFSLTIKSTGTYRFVTYRTGCPSTNCCDIQVIQGPYGSLGDLAFNDLNKDGARTPGEPGIDKIKVYLYDQLGKTILDSTVTADGGKYLFSNLTDGSYVVRFITPTGYQSTTANAAGVPDDLNSDAGVNGFTGVYTIDTSQPTSSTARNNLTVDAGFYVPNTGLGDLAFVDLNKNGIRDDNEPGLANVIVILYVNGVESLTTITNSTGFYSFTGLTPGSSNNYSVGFTTPANYTATLANVGGDPTKDSDIDPITGKTQSVTLALGEFNSTLDAGFYIPLASLGDLVFADTNKDGIHQSSEPGIPNVVVVLLDGTNTAIASTTTNSSGIYFFTGLTPGVPYSVSFVTPAGYTSTSAQVGGDDTKDSDANPITGKTRSVTLAAGENNLNLDAGFYVPSITLGHIVFLDANKDGIQQSDEPGIPNVVVVLLDGTNTAIASVTTSSSGLYSFTGLTPGVPYSVSFVTPAGYTLTSAQVGGDDSKDSDANPITGKTRSVTLAAGEINLNLNAGFYIPSCPTDFSLVVSNNATICNGDTTKLIASTSVPGAQIRWYLTPTDGTAFATVGSGIPIPVNPIATTVYYAEAFTDAGCKSVRKPVSVTVTTLPTPTLAGNAQNTCPATTVDLTSVTIANRTTGLTYEWYTSLNRSASTRVTNLTAVGAGQYYLFATAGTCYSNPALLTVGITNCNCQNIAGVNVGPGVTVCAADLIPLRAVLSGSATSVVWASSGTGTFSSPASLTTTYIPSTADITTGNVVLTATTNDPDGPGGVCQSGTSSLLATIHARPAAPLDVACDDTLVCQGSPTKLIGFAPGSQINWYDADGKLIGTTPSGGKLVVTPAKSGAVVYTAEAFSPAGCVSGRTSLTITVGRCLANLAVVKTIVTPGPYSIGQKITYAITTTNKGPITANGVTVSEVLPASLTYVSSTPAGQYNPATGLWTIGTMTANSDRSLLVETMIVQAGSTKNTVIVSSPDNDPNYIVDDTSAVFIDINACAVNPPTILCAIAQICKGGTTTLSANGCAEGTVRWSDGKTGLTIFSTPATTTVYTASCLVGNCLSAASNPITVVVLDPKAPTITASADNVCPGTPVTLTASGCPGGTIEWSDKAQTGPSIVVTPNGKTTYTAQCRQGSCLSSPATKTIGIVTDLPTPTLVSSTSVVCPGETVTLTVANCLGTPIWNSTTATTGSILVSPSLGNNSYSVYCKTGACVSKSSAIYTINVVAPVIPTVTASADTVCANGAVTLTAADCNGTVVWNGGGQTGMSITVSPTASTRYFAQCRYRTCLSAQSNTVAITVATPTTPIITVSSTTLCSGTKLTLTAKGCGGTVQWHGVAKTGASIELYPTGTTDYYATCKQGTCESEASNKVRVTVSTSSAPAPVVTASMLAVCTGGVVSLSATGCAGGTVKWSDGQSGSVVSVTATPANQAFYALCQVGSQCGTGKSNVITLTVTPTPTPSIVRCLCSSDTICPGEAVKLSVKNCQGTPYWSTGETTTSIVVSPTVTTGYSVYCQAGVCQSPSTPAYPITVIPVAAPSITASATVVAAGSTVTLSASGCAGTVTWSANGISGTNKGASIVVLPEGTQTYYAQCQFRGCLSDPSATIVVNPGDCVAKAGTLVAVNGTVCGGSSGTVSIGATLNGGLVQPSGYSILYVLSKGTASIVQQTGSTPQFVVPSGAADYTIHTLVYTANVTDKNYLDLTVVKPGLTSVADLQQLLGSTCASLDVAGAKVRVTVVNPPVLSAGASLTACSGGVVSLSATGCEGGTVSWSDGTMGASYAKPIYSDKTLTATCTVTGCVSMPSASVRITLGTPAIPIIVSNASAVCLGEVVSLTATGCAGGTYVWSDGKTVGPALTITPTADVRYRVMCQFGACVGDWSAYTTIKVGAPAAPTISIIGSSAGTTTCFGTPVTLVAQGCSANSYVTWSNNQVGASITVSLASSTTLTAQCCNSTQCKSAPSNALAVTVLPKLSQPTVVDKTNACPFVTVDLATAVSSQPVTPGGVFAYFTDASLSGSSSVANPAAVGTGTYYVVERTVTGCVSLPVAIHVQINACVTPTPCDSQNPATANAGADASICGAKTYSLTGVMGGAGTTAHWTSSGSGSFDNAYALTAVYTASSADILSGNVTLSLSVSANNAACPVATDAMLLTINGIKSIPAITVVGGTRLCYGDSVTLRAPAGASGYAWSNQATGSTIVVKSSGVYTVQLFDAMGCSSVPSAGVAISVADPVAKPLVTNLRNACPAKIVDLTKALSSPTAGSSYLYRICECNSSNIVIRPDSVCEGTYWIVERSASGCSSAPAKVVVKVFNCASDTLATDVRITKLASTSVVRNGSPVSYTITVSNAGPHTAHHIDVRDVLPKGLELLPSSIASSRYRVSNGVISQRIDSLRVGQSEQLVFTARLTEKGVAVVNQAEITYLDNPDTNLANNRSSVSVTDSSTHRASRIGLAKAVLGKPVAVGDSLIKVSYSFLATNFGDDTLRNVKVTDDLAYAFSPNHIQSAKLTLASGSTLKANPAFTGLVPNFQLLDTLSRILPGASQTFRLDVVVRRTAGDTTRTFRNIANASATNSLTTVTDMSVNGGDSDPDNDGDPTNNAGFSSFTLSPVQTQAPSLGLALAVVKVEQQPDSSYTVTYKATLKNFGDVDLNGIVLTDSLVRVFASPASYSVVGTPVVGAGSTLVANTGFNGNTQSTILSSASQLAAGVQDTVLIRVNIKPNGNNGPFYSSATVVGHTADSSQVVKDISNNGFDPAPAGSVSTTVRFDLPKGLLGVAKSVGVPTLVRTGIYDIPYTITLSNMGTVPLKKVQVVDNLTKTFGHGALIVSNQISVTNTGSVSVNPTYTGQGLVTNLLVDSTSTLAVGAKSNLSFTVRVDVTKADSLTFFNVAQATALTPTGELVSDQSTAGTNNDPDNDLDPRNNSTPTPVALNSLSTTAYIGLALGVRDTVRQTDGSFNVTYQLVVKNYGAETIRNVRISDTLSTVFNSQTGSRFSVVKVPFTTSTGSALKLNPAYNGGSDPALVLGDSTSTLAAGKVDTLQMVINVASNGSTTTFLNSAYATGLAKSGAVSDVSTSGLNPDLNGNGNPTDANEREATPLNLPATYLALFIPEGFSPNGDGINDLFVIRGAAGLTVSLEVYNRWGHLVYKNDDYRNDWDGKPNQGIAISSGADGVPDGTYYYVINTSDGRKFVRYMTINR